MKKLFSFFVLAIVALIAVSVDAEVTKFTWEVDSKIWQGGLMYDGKPYNQVLRWGTEPNVYTDMQAISPGDLTLGVFPLVRYEFVNPPFLKGQEYFLSLSHIWDGVESPGSAPLYIYEEDGLNLSPEFFYSANVYPFENYGYIAANIQTPVNPKQIYWGTTGVNLFKGETVGVSFHGYFEGAAGKAPISFHLENSSGQAISCEVNVFIDTTYDKYKAWIFAREDAASWVLVANFGHYTGYYEFQQILFQIIPVAEVLSIPKNVERFFVRSLKPKTGTELHRAEFYWSQVPLADGYIIRFAKTLYNFVIGINESMELGQNDLLYGAPVIIEGGAVQTYELPITTEINGGVYAAITSFKNHTVNGEAFRRESNEAITYAILPGNITGVASDPSPPLYLQMSVDATEVAYAYNAYRLNNITVPTPPADQPASKEELADIDNNNYVGRVTDYNFIRSQNLTGKKLQ